MVGSGSQETGNNFKTIFYHREHRGTEIWKRFFDGFNRQLLNIKA